MAWDNPRELGLDSKILTEVMAHYELVRSHLAPRDMPARGDFSKAVSLAWQAVWRARDYTVDGWVRRLGGNSAEQENTRRQLSLHALTRENEKWPAFFVPAFDKAGELRNSKIDTSRWIYPRVLSDRECWDGLVLPLLNNGLSGLSAQVVIEWAFVLFLPSPHLNFEHSLFNGRSQWTNAQQISESVVFGDASIKGGDLSSLSGVKIFGDLSLGPGELSNGHFPNKLDVLGEVTLNCSIRGNMLLESSNGIRTLSVKNARLSGNVEIHNASGLETISIRGSSDVHSLPLGNIIVRNVQGLAQVIIEGVELAGDLHLEGLDVSDDISLIALKICGSCSVEKCVVNRPGNSGG